MPKKKYAQQCGPNLVFYDVNSDPDCAVTHKHGCGGMLAQDLGGGDMAMRSQLPKNTPGKVFCYECGHKAGRAVTAALKTGENINHFYFPGKAEYELRPKIHIEGNPQRVFRYWSWEGGLSQPEQPFARLRMPKKLRKVQRLAPKTVITQEDDDWIITHPRITIRLPMAQFNSGDAAKVERAWRSSANIDKSTAELEIIARDALDVGFVAIMNHPEFFGVVEGDTVVIMRRPAWDSELVGIFANNIKGTPADQIENCASIFAQAHGKLADSFTVETDFLDKIENGEPFNAAAEDIDIPEIKRGPFLENSDMLMSPGKCTISYTRGNGTHWFLCLNRDIWNDEECEQLRVFVRTNVFMTPDDFLTAIVSQAENHGYPSDGHSLTIANTIDGARNVGFLPCPEEDVNF
jgi:hypothetical protein